VNSALVGLYNKRLLSICLTCTASHPRKRQFFNYRRRNNCAIWVWNWDKI